MEPSARAPDSTNLAALLRSLSPRLNAGTWVFVTVPLGRPPPAAEPLASFREAEGLTLVLREAEAEAAGLTPLFHAAWLTLDVHSDLAAVGLTARVAQALAEAGVSCNAIAASHHDHLFVPVEQADAAILALRALSAASRA
jgi:hypothetical protein